MDYLRSVPLSSASIRENLRCALTEWQRLAAALDHIAQADVLGQVCDASERLLDVTERLTDHYEQAMQMLIGDRIGRMA